MWEGVVRAFKQHAADTVAHLKAETQAFLKARTLKRCESMSGALSRSAPLCFWHLLRTLEGAHGRSDCPWPVGLAAITARFGLRADEFVWR